ncbi:hypothetical protein CASFOL_038484 [Castilleja foliolosa]|uniref:Uncharacterized protein n=1 Tax=Castilleja foliolosa TaxID=1961234 RepID=A0ABD3BL36_9LAMI
MATNTIIVNATSSIQEDARPPIVSYTPTMWADTFTSFSLDHQVQQKYAQEIETLKVEARSMLIMSKEKTTSERLVLIETLERLGIAYHFHPEIEEQLEHIFKSYSSENTEEQNHDLFITSLQFRLLRQHRLCISCNVFDKFIGEEDKFKESFSDDTKGLLSLYEAAHLRVHGEPILDEAVIFAKYHLKRRLVEQLDSSTLQEQVKRALKMPLHRGNRRIDTRHYISVYEKDESKNNILLKLAKLDFNYLLNMYKDEICQVSRWWNELDMKSKFPYMRDRVVEAYLWGSSYNLEPQYGYVRMAVAKAIQVLTIFDDTYDNYATVEEADLFTQIIERWNIEEIDQLPDYMKIIYRFTLSVFEDYERDAADQGKLFLVPYAIEAAYNKETKWITRQEMPSFQEYIENSVIAGCLFSISSMTLPGVTSVTKETIDWLMTVPKIGVASSTVCRYLDDLSSFKRESKNGEYQTGVDHYMEQHGLSLEETKDKFIELAEDEWKDLNTEWMNKTRVPKDMLEQILGYARSSELFYRSCEDGFANAGVMAGHIVALFVDPIIIL